MPILSVIIPTYNSELTIERCLNSLANQTYQDFEVCIIDALSSDSTLPKVNELRSNFNEIRILSESDQGTYDAMNKGIALAKGEWLYFLGSDDELYDDNVLSDVFMLVKSTQCELIYGDVYVKGDTLWAKDNQIYDGPFDVHKLLSKNICHQAIFYKKSLFKRHFIYKLKYPMCADWDLNIRLFSKSKSIYINRVVAVFYGGGISSTEFTDPIFYD